MEIRARSRACAWLSMAVCRQHLAWGADSYVRNTRLIALARAYRAARAMRTLSRRPALRWHAPLSAAHIFGLGDDALFRGTHGLATRIPFAAPRAAAINNSIAHSKQYSAMGDINVRHKHKLAPLDMENIAPWRDMALVNRREAWYISVIWRAVRRAVEAAGIR